MKDEFAGSEFIWGNERGQMLLISDKSACEECGDGAQMGRPGIAVEEPFSMPGDSALTVAVLIPTYRRPDDLQRCLKAIAAQTRPAEQVIVVYRPEDEETGQVLKAQSRLVMPLEIVPVSVPGVVAALNVGLSHAATEILAITDDDSTPHPDWLQRIVAHFERDPRLAGVGGRDQVFAGDVAVVGKANQVGLVQWCGRTVGGHHLGYGDTREVDVLKGVNMAFRRSLVQGVQFDPRLRGSGAQVNNELGFCLALRRLQHRLIYDPSVLVDHFESPRGDDERVSEFRCSSESVYDSSYNEGLIIVEHFAHMSHGALRVMVFLLWSFFIGTRKAPGLFQALRFTPRHHLHSWRRFLVTQAAKARAAYDAKWP